MKIDCQVIRDLLPQYFEDICSDESRNIIEDHLNECDDCKDVFKAMKSETLNFNEAVEKNINEKQIIENFIKRIKISTAAITTFLISTILFWGIWLIKAFAWLRYEDKLENVLLTLLGILTFVMILSGLVVLLNIFKKIYTNKKVKLIIMTFLLGIAINMCMIYISIDGGAQIGGVFSIVSKATDENQYYFIIKDPYLYQDIKIECDKNTYDKLIIDDSVLYAIEYRRIFFIKDTAFLGSID